MFYQFTTISALDFCYSLFLPFAGSCSAPVLEFGQLTRKIMDDEGQKRFQTGSSIWTSIYLSSGLFMYFFWHPGNQNPRSSIWMKQSAAKEALTALVSTSSSCIFNSLLFPVVIVPKQVKHRHVFGDQMLHTGVQAKT